MRVAVRMTVLTALTMALAALTFAASKNNEAGFTLENSARIGTTDLQPGDYKAQWTPGSGGAVKVEILRHGKPVATVDGKIKDLPSPAPYSAIVTSPGKNEINEIDFANRKEALVFGE